VMGKGTGVVFSVLKKVTGVDLLTDLSVFFKALGGLIDGFKERAEGVKAILTDPATTFLIVSSPEREPVDEAIFLRGKLREAGMPFGGLVVNRVHIAAADAAQTDTLAADLSGELGDKLAGKVARTLEEFRVLAVRDAASIVRLSKELGEKDPIVIPHLDGDVHDVEGLLAIRRHLFADGAEREELLAEAAV
jgi:anion-transporting  ArsA/GET3 family ATPase